MRNWLEENYFINKKSKTGKIFKYPNGEAAKNRNWWIVRDVEKLYDDLLKIGYDKMTDNVYYYMNNLSEKPKCKLCEKELARPQMEFCSTSCRSKVLSSLNKEKISESNKKTKQTQFLNRFPKNKAEDWNNKEFLQTLYDKGKIQLISEHFDCCFTTAFNHSVDLDLDLTFKTSVHEGFVCDLLKENGIEYIQNSYKIIPPLQLDIFIPEKNIAFEINGLFWHSENSGGKTRKYHLNKTEECEKKGIRLFHIFSNELIVKNKIWESVILNVLGIYKKKIGARKTVARMISSKDTYLFCEENHLQGASNSSINYGLFFNDELVSVMTFSKARMTNAEWELQRFCSKLGYSVQGAASKLLKEFKKDHKGSIVSYANRRWSQGNLYKKLGFEFNHNSSPNYFYFKGNGNWDYSELYTRIKFQKHKLKNFLPEFDERLSEWENMKMNKFDRIWDSGNKVYILE